MSKNRAFLDKHADKISKFLVVIIIFGVFVSCFESVYRVETMYAFSKKTNWSQQIEDLNYFDNEKIIVKDAPLAGFEVMGTQTKNRIYLDKDIKYYSDFLYYYTHEYFHYLQQQYPLSEPLLVHYRSTELTTKQEKLVANKNDEILTDLITYKLLNVDNLSYLETKEAKNMLKDDDVKKYVDYYIKLSKFNNNHFNKMTRIDL